VLILFAVLQYKLHARLSNRNTTGYKAPPCPGGPHSVSLSLRFCDDLDKLALKDPVRIPVSIPVSILFVICHCATVCFGRCWLAIAVSRHCQEVPRQCV
jgi:hypothetical protein